MAAPRRIIASGYSVPEDAERKSGIIPSKWRRKPRQQRVSFILVNVVIFPTSAAASKQIAIEIRDLIRKRAAEGRMAVLGLATGRTPLHLYAELVRMHRVEELSFSNVVTFNLDEYQGLDPLHPQSYRTFMQENLFDHVDILPANIHIPSGNLAPGEVASYCQGYEAAIADAGGIDLQILGIGRTGHIGFNEPGAGRNSRTMSVHLDRLTREDAAADFGRIEDVPTSAITMGCGTILAARRIVLMAWGAGKAAIVARAFQSRISDDVPASYLQEHGDATVVLDEAAAADMNLRKAPTEKDHVLQG